MESTQERFGARIDARSVLERDRADLIRLLGDLRAEEWHQPTAAGRWLVRDLVAHVLGDDVSRLSRTRDGHSGEGPRASEELADFIHRINDEWVEAASRISPSVLTELLKATSPQLLRMWRELDLDALGDPVTWAGFHPAPVWLDCARDFTEYWVHQQQIRDATGRHDTGSAETMHTVLDTFLRALPHTLAHRRESEGTVLTVIVTDSDSGGAWSVARSAGQWRWINAGDSATAATTISCTADTLWRLCVRDLAPHEAQRRSTIIGDPFLADAALHIVSIIR